MTISRLLFAAASFMLAVTVAPAQATDVMPPEGAAQPANDACAKLASLHISNVTITSATAFATGAYKPPSGPGGGNESAFYSKLPGFCRVIAKATPSADSDIAIEIWLPLEGWNGKLQGTGNGGFAGSYDTGELARIHVKRLRSRSYRYRPCCLIHRRCVGARPS